MKRIKKVVSENFSYLKSLYSESRKKGKLDLYLSIAFIISIGVFWAYSSCYSYIHELGHTMGGMIVALSKRTNETNPVCVYWVFEGNAAKQTFLKQNNLFQYVWQDMLFSCGAGVFVMLLIVFFASISMNLVGFFVKDKRKRNAANFSILLLMIALLLTPLLGDIIFADTDCLKLSPLIRDNIILSFFVYLLPMILSFLLFANLIFVLVSSAKKREKEVNVHKKQVRHP